MYLMNLLLGIWKAPKPSRSRSYRMASQTKNKTEHIFAKAKIISVLTGEWKTNKQIAADADLQINTVQQKTAKLHKEGKIDKITRKEQEDTKPVCLYRQIQGGEDV